MLETIGIHKKDISSEEWEKALKGLERGDEYRIITDGSWIEWRDEFTDLLIRDRDFIVTIRKAKKTPFPSNNDLANAFRSVGKSMCSNGLNVSENKEAKEPQDKTEQAHRQAENLDGILAERGARYGSFASQAAFSQYLKDTLRKHKNYDELMHSQKEALEMIMHKISRILNGDPNYDDSWRDIAGYAELIVKELNENTIKG